MIRRTLLLACLFLTSSAFATWNPKFSSSDETLITGQTTTITTVGRPLTLIAISPTAALTFTTAATSAIRPIRFMATATSWSSPRPRPAATRSGSRHWPPRG